MCDETRERWPFLERSRHVSDERRMVARMAEEEPDLAWRPEIEWIIEVRGSLVLPVRLYQLCSGLRVAARPLDGATEPVTGRPREIVRTFGVVVEHVVDEGGQPAALIGIVPIDRLEQLGRRGATNPLLRFYLTRLIEPVLVEEGHDLADREGPPAAHCLDERAAQACWYGSGHPVTIRNPALSDAA